MQIQVDESRQRLQESSKLVASNQEIIAYLNDELNKWQLGMSVGGQVEYDYSASTLAKLAKTATTPTPLSMSYNNKNNNNNSTSGIDRTKPIYSTSGNSHMKETPIPTKRYEKPMQVVSVTPDEELYEEYPAHSHQSTTQNNTGPVSFRKSRGGGSDFVTQYDKIPSIPTQIETHETRVDRTDNDILLQGIKNLGLTEDSLVDDLGLILGNKNINNNNNSNNSNTLSGQNTNNRNKLEFTTSISPQDYMPSHDGGMPYTSEAYSQSDLDLLEAMDYYSTTSHNNYNNNTTRTSTNSSRDGGISTGGRAGGSGSIISSTIRDISKQKQSSMQQPFRQYSWQDDDFLLSSE